MVDSASRYVVTEQIFTLMLNHNNFEANALHHHVDNNKIKRYLFVLLASRRSKCHWFRFALQPASFELQTILRQVHQMTPKWHWIQRDQRSPYNCCPASFISLLCVYDPLAFLELQAILWQQYEYLNSFLQSTFLCGIFFCKVTLFIHYVTKKNAYSVKQESKYFFTPFGPKGVNKYLCRADVDSVTILVKYIVLTEFTSALHTAVIDALGYVCFKFCHGQKVWKKKRIIKY